MRSYHFLLLLVICLLPACAPKYGGLCPTNGQSVDLDQWVDEELIPYLAERLGRYPRFTGQAVYFVGLEGDNIKAELDGLTLSIRDRIKASLYGINGVNLAWRPQVGGKSSRGSLTDVPCHKSEQIAYYIGLDLQQSPYDGRISTQVRALDLNEQSWVDGFGICWEGTLSNKQKKIFSKRYLDASLLGMRAYPFNRQQPDLTAAYLAEELSCQFRDTRHEELIIHILHDTNDPYLNSLSELLSRYLGRFSEVKISKKADHATVLIRLRAEQIDGDLYQVWASGEYQGGGSYLIGAEIDAYVLMEQGAPLKIAKQEIIASPMAQVISIHATEASENILQNIQFPIIPEPTAPFSNRGMIDRFEMHIPNVSQLCNSNTPWLMGERMLSPNEPLSNGDCIALTITPAMPSYLILLHQDEFGGLHTLRNTWQTGEGMIFPGVEYRFPTPESGDVLLLDGYRGTEWVHAITVSDPNLAADFEDMLFPGMNVQMLHNLLAELQNKQGQPLDYQSISFMHQ